MMRTSFGFIVILCRTRRRKRLRRRLLSSNPTVSTRPLWDRAEGRAFLLERRELEETSDDLSLETLKSTLLLEDDAELSTPWTEV